ncbi:hypothetical protein RI129_002308 [Pyrocoelia pectoralis]|uniref:Uncharacterized protein n=1 Tax=Pyrocoelia pectoralis TaxID=417401 RepID=A0AAN7VLM4_9COLE
MSNSSDELEEIEPSLEGEIETGDFVLVKFLAKTTSIHYVGRIEQINSPVSFTVKFMRRKGCSHTFIFPTVEDISDADISSIVARLHPPTQTGTARTSSIFTFNYRFSNLNVK